MVVEFIISMVYSMGYFGLFLASLISSASVILPVPGFLIVITAGTFLNPFLVGIVAAIGAAIGELTAYGVGFAGEKAFLKLKKKKNWKREFERAEKWFEKHSGFFVVIVFAATPLPFDAIGIFCGVVKYDIKKFFIATLIGKLIANIALAYLGFLGITIIGGWLFG
ncbi:YqaA family protein [Candidatus Aenigmatarchaeota archaeon]